MSSIGTRDMYVGKVIPLHDGAASQVLLAWRPALAETVLCEPMEALTEATVTIAAELRDRIAQARTQGYAVSSGERPDSASGIAAPVFDAQGDIVGALSVSGPTLRMPPHLCRAWVDYPVGCAEKTTRTMGGHPPARSAHAGRHAHRQWSASTSKTSPGRGVSSNRASCD